MPLAEREMKMRSAKKKKKKLEKLLETDLLLLYHLSMCLQYFNTLLLTIRASTRTKSTNQPKQTQAATNSTSYKLSLTVTFQTNYSMLHLLIVILRCFCNTNQPTTYTRTFIPAYIHTYVCIHILAPSLHTNTNNCNQN